MSAKKLLAKVLFKITGYSMVGEKFPDEAGILIGAPHTSNWDFVAFACVAFHEEKQIKVLVKEQWFHGISGWLIRKIGGIPVNRENPGATTAELTKLIREGHKFQLAIAPKGTRHRHEYWKSGFYRIAQQADVPITCVSTDSRRKEIEVGPTFRPSGNVKADMDLVRAFYADKAGIKPENRSEPRLRMESESV